MGHFIAKSSPTNSFTKIDDSVTADDFILNLIKKSDIVLFSRTNCSFCQKAKTALENLNLQYYSVELDINSNCPRNDCTSVSRALVLQTRFKKVPQIFINGTFIGGYKELQLWIKEKNL